MWMGQNAACTCQSAGSCKMRKVSMDSLDHNQLYEGKPHTDNIFTASSELVPDAVFADGSSTVNNRAGAPDMENQEDIGRSIRAAAREAAVLCCRSPAALDVPKILLPRGAGLPPRHKALETPSLMKIFIRTCPVSQDSVNETDTNEEDSCSCHREHQTLSLNIQAIEVNSKSQCRMLVDTANGVDPPCSKSWNGDWTAEWVAEQQEALKGCADPSSNSGDRNLQHATDSGFSTEGASGGPGKEHHEQEAVEEEVRFKKGQVVKDEADCIEPESTKNENLKEGKRCSSAKGCTELRGKGNESCPSHVGVVDRAGFVFRKPLQAIWNHERHHRGWWLPRVVRMGKSTKGVLAEDSSCGVSFQEMSTSVSHQILLSSHGISNQRVAGNTCESQGGLCDVGVESHEAIQPSDGIFWIDSNNVPNMVLNSEPSGASWTLSLSQGVQVSKSGMEAQAAQVSNTSSSLWSDFSQRTPAQGIFWFGGESRNSMQEGAGQR